MKRMIPLILPLLVALPAHASEAPLPTLSVRGEAVVKVPADKVSFNLGVETIAVSADKALADNNAMMQKVRQQIARQGFTESEYRTGSFSVQPQWQPRPRQAASDWRPKIVSYLVRNQLQVETAQISKVGDLIQAAAEVGANSIGQLNFGLSDPDKYRNQAISRATRKARGYAAAAAEAADINLLSVQTIQVDGAAIAPPQYQHRKMEMMMSSADAAGSTLVTAGDIEVRASVSISYRLVQE